MANRGRSPLSSTRKWYYIVQSTTEVKRIIWSNYLDRQTNTSSQRPRKYLKSVRSRSGVLCLFCYCMLYSTIDATYSEEERESLRMSTFAPWQILCMLCGILWYSKQWAQITCILSVVANSVQNATEVRGFISTNTLLRNPCGSSCHLSVWHRLP
jgi:hypothetical protein